MENIPIVSGPNSEALLAPLESQINTSVLDTAPTAQEELTLSSGQIAVLHCIACITDRGDNPAANTARIASQCTGRSGSTVRRNITSLEDKGLVTSEERDSSEVQRRGSHQQHRLTKTGISRLPPDWSKCETVEDLSSPIASLNEKHRKLLRCVTCITGQGDEALNTSIAYCVDDSPNNILRAMQKLADEGILHSSHVGPQRGKGNNTRLSYKPAMPLPPSIVASEACNLSDRKNERLLAELTPEQKQTLGCIACIANRSDFAYGASKGSVESCTGLDQTMTFRNGHKLAALGLITVHSSGFAKAGTTRTYYEPNEAGIAAASELSVGTCKNIENPATVNTVDTILRCLQCIWGKQVNADVKPAAAVAMIRDCTGLSDIGVRKRLTKLAKQGKIRQEVDSRTGPSGAPRSAITFAPASRLIELQPVGSCESILYSQIPEKYLAPFTVSDLTLAPKGSPEEKAAMRAFIAANREHRLLTQEEELALGYRIRAATSDEERKQAISLLVEHNLKLALWYAAHKANFEGLFLSYEDRVQEALIGIEAAASRFDPSYSVKFSTYAFYWMRHRVQRAAALHAGVPIDKFTRIPTTYYAATDFEARYGRVPTIVEVAHASNLTPHAVADVLEARDSIRKDLSLDYDLGAKQNNSRRFGNSSLHETVGFSEDKFTSIETFEAVQKLLPHLADYEKSLLGNILGLHDTPLRKIGTMFGISHTTAQKARLKIESLLRHPYFGIAASYDRSREWQFDATCSNTNDSRVLDRLHGRTEVSPEVARLCGFCPVRKECFTETLKGDVPVMAGIWAGYNVAQLRKYYVRSRSTRVTTKSMPATSIAQSS